MLGDVERLLSIIKLGKQAKEWLLEADITLTRNFKVYTAGDLQLRSGLTPAFDSCFCNKLLESVPKPDAIFYVQPEESARPQLRKFGQFKIPYEPNEKLVDIEQRKMEQLAAQFPTLPIKKLTFSTETTLAELVAWVKSGIRDLQKSTAN